MLNWAHSRGIVLRLIEPGKPNQNAYVESFNTGRADTRPVREATGREAAYNASRLQTHLLLRAGGRPQGHNQE